MEKRLLTLIAVLLAAALCAWRIEARKPPPRPVSLSPALPLRAGRWTGRRIPVSARERRVLRAGHLEHIEYRREGNSTVRLYLVGAPRDRTSFHPPEYCFIAQTGGSITSMETIRIPAGDREIIAAEFVLSQDNRKTYVLYWYRVGDYFTPHYYAYQIAYLRGKFFGPNPGKSMLVRLSTDFAGGGRSRARQRIRNLLESLSSSGLFL